MYKVDGEIAFNKTEVGVFMSLAAVAAMTDRGTEEDAGGEILYDPIVTAWEEGRWKLRRLEQTL